MGFRTAGSRCCGLPDLTAGRAGTAWRQDPQLPLSPLWVVLPTLTETRSRRWGHASDVRPRAWRSPPPTPRPAGLPTCRRRQPASSVDSRPVRRRHVARVDGAAEGWRGGAGARGAQGSAGPGRERASRGWRGVGSGSPARLASAVLALRRSRWGRPGLWPGPRTECAPRISALLSGAGAQTRAHSLAIYS